MFDTHVYGSSVKPMVFRTIICVNNNYPCEEGKGRIPNFYYIHGKNLLLHYILDLYIYTCSWVPQYSKKIKGKDCIISNTPPQVGAYMSYAPSLLQMYLILGPLRDLVKMSAS